MIIVTPTYNRRQELPNLVASLEKQTCQDFTWLVIDDGSTDGTAEYLKDLQKNSLLDIEYYYQPNQGKAIAYNQAFQHMPVDEVHLVVDSDDELLPNAVATFYEDLQQIPQQIGLVYPKTIVGEPTKWLPNKVQAVNIMDIRFKYGLKIETCIVLKNQYIGDFRFPTTEGETFCSEELFYNTLINKGTFKPCATEVYRYKYLADGLTSNLFTMQKNNPHNTRLLFQDRQKYVQQNLKGPQRFLELIKVRLNKIAFNLVQPDGSALSEADLCDWLLMPAALILKQIRYHK